VNVQEPVLLSWSGGKDSSMALYELVRGRRFRVASLLTNVSEEYGRISIHGVRQELLERQADAISLPLHVVLLSQGCTNEEYERSTASALKHFHNQAIHTVAFGDIFLADLRAYREDNLKRIGMSGLFPIWQRNTRELAEQFLALGFRAIVVCVDTKKLDAAFAGRAFDASLLDDLPAEVDPCGENGEFHTFVFDGPLFQRPVRLKRGEVVTRDGFAYCDLLPG
jgi:uncharacterized protein (TIGR00290 family)